ncbi:MAG: hypothetical protein U5Q03_11035 [Bacteroidota bacterium]|nr:hypothetical protein [Bacteroidota bacterium]
MKSYHIILFVLVLFSAEVWCQDSHYWTQQFGARASARGGAFVAGADNNSAVFYNPAALAFIDQASLSVNATLYKAQRTFIRNGLGDDHNLRSMSYNYYPQLISGMIETGKQNKFSVAYILMTRHSNDIKFNTRVNMLYDVISSVEGRENFIGAFEYGNSFSEQWGGLGIAYRLSEDVSLGLTPFVSYRYQQYRFSVYSRAIPVVDSSYYVASFSNYDDILFVNWKLILKAGLKIQKEHWNFGLTLTAPSINLYGDCDVQREVTIENMRLDSPEEDFFDFLAIDRQPSLPIHMKSPFSVAFGVEHLGNKTRIEVSGEYYGRLKIYKMIRAEALPFIYPTEIFDEIDLGELEFLSVYDYADPVFNVAVAIEQKISQKLTYIGSFRTDFTMHRNDSKLEEFSLYGGDWNLFHLASGLSFTKEKSRFTATLMYYFGFEKNIEQLVNFSEPKEEFSFLGIPGDNAEISVHSLGLAVGYTYFFND